MDFKIKELKDFFRLLIFFIVSPVIGIVMFIGMVGTSLGLLFIYVKGFIKNKEK